MVIIFYGGFMGLNIEAAETIVKYAEKCIKKNAAAETKTINSVFESIKPNEISLNQHQSITKVQTESVFSSVKKKLLNLFGKNKNINNSVTKQNKPLTKSDLESLLYYCSNDGVAGGAARCKPDNIPDFYKNFQKIVRKSELNEDMILYRGIRQDEILRSGFEYAYGTPIDKFLNTETYISRGFSSTSRDFNIAEKYHSGNKIMFKIHAPKGTNCLSLEDNTSQLSKYVQEKAIADSKTINDFAKNEGFTKEKEVIFPMGTKFKINGHEITKDDLMIVDVSIIK